MLYFYKTLILNNQGYSSHYKNISTLLCLMLKMKKTFIKQ